MEGQAAARSRPTGIRFGRTRTPVPASLPDVPATASTPADAGHAAALPQATPVSRIGIILMASLLALVLVMGIARNGILQALGDLGFRSPAIAAYTLMLMSPLAFESAYPALSRRLRAGTRRARVLESLHAHAPYLIVVGLVMLVMRIENIWDLDLTAALGWDFTLGIHAIEGNVVGDLQRSMRHPWLDQGLTFVYVVVYALYHVVALLAFASTGKTGLVKRLTLTWCGIYAIALPFYLLFPVNEAWVTNAAYDCGYGNPDSPLGLLHDECGASAGIVFAISSINNCFPSLHNAFAWALPFLLWQSGRRKWAAMVAPVALAVSLSTLYLGIHWVTDLVAGILLSYGVTWVAVRLDYTLDPRLRLRGLTWKRKPEPV